MKQDTGKGSPWWAWALVIGGIVAYILAMGAIVGRNTTHPG